VVWYVDKTHCQLVHRIVDDGKYAAYFSGHAGTFGDPDPVVIPENGLFEGWSKKHNWIENENFFTHMVLHELYHALSLADEPYSDTNYCVMNERPFFPYWAGNWAVDFWPDADAVQHQSAALNHINSHP